VTLCSPVDGHRSALLAETDVLMVAFGEVRYALSVSLTAGRTKNESCSVFSSGKGSHAITVAARAAGMPRD